MRIRELIETTLDEVNMSPGALKDFADTPLARSMTAGFEAEMIIPNEGYDEENDIEADWDADERVSSWSDIEDFFVGEYNSRREVERAIERLQEDFFDYVSERKYDDWHDDELENVRTWLLLQDYSEDEIDDILSDIDSDKYEKARDKAKASFMDDYEIDDVMQETWFKKNLRNMSDVANSTDLTWPHYLDHSPKMTMEDIADIISRAIGMDVEASEDYHSAERGENHFVLEPDTSIKPNDRKNETGMELVSPPMPLGKCLEYMTKVFDWANDHGCYTNKSTGFHMGISIPDQTMENVDHLKFILFLGDEYVLEQFGRDTNTYTKSMVKVMKSQVSRSEADVEDMLLKLKQGLDSAAAKTMTRALSNAQDDRYVSVNIKDNYIEVRSAGGNYLGELSQIKLTLMRYVRVMGLAADPNAEKQEYAKKLYKFLTSMIKTDDDSIKYFSQYSANTLPLSALKSFIRKVQRTRADKMIPDSMTVNTPQDGRWAWIVGYQNADGKKKTIKIYASSRTDALAKVNQFIPAGYDVKDIRADLEDPTNKSNGSGDGDQKNFRIGFNIPGNNVPQETSIWANSRREALASFNSQFPDDYILTSMTERT